MACIATPLMLGSRLRESNLQTKRSPQVGVKEVVLLFNRFPEVDPVLGIAECRTGKAGVKPLQQHHRDTQ